MQPDIAGVRVGELDPFLGQCAGQLVPSWTVHCSDALGEGHMLDTMATQFVAEADAPGRLEHHVAHWSPTRHPLDEMVRFPDARHVSGRRTQREPFQPAAQDGAFGMNLGE